MKDFSHHFIELAVAHFPILSGLGVMKPHAAEARHDFLFAHIHFACHSLVLRHIMPHLNAAVFCFDYSGGEVGMQEKSVGFPCGFLTDSKDQ